MRLEEGECGEECRAYVRAECKQLKEMGTEICKGKGEGYSLSYQENDAP